MENSRAAVAAVGMMMMAAVAGPAAAQDSPWYVGGHLARADYTAVREQDTGWGALFGYEFKPNYAVEIGYADFGEISESTPGSSFWSVGTTVYEIAGIGAFEITDRFSLFGRLGVYRAETIRKIDVVEFHSSTERFSNTDASYGLGARFDFSSNLAFRGGWQRYSDAVDSDVDVLSVAVLVRF